MDSDTNRRKPKVLIPFAPADMAAEVGDVVVYLRPETNGMPTESVLFRELRNHPGYGSSVKIVYLANIPGEYIVSNHIMEDHYHMKIEFAWRGGDMFTPSMIRRFEQWSGESFEATKLLGAFQYIEKTEIDEEDLFRIRVEKQDFTVINGQTIKRLGMEYIVNYDIPAVLHKNCKNTDIAVFMLRSSLSYEAFAEVIRAMENSLLDTGILDSNLPPSRGFHYSRGPFEQILDAKGFLYHPDGSHIYLRELCFYRYLLSRGLGPGDIDPLINNPIMIFSCDDGTEAESDLFSFTRRLSYEDAYRAVLHAKPVHIM